MPHLTIMNNLGMGCK